MPHDAAFNLQRSNCPQNVEALESLPMNVDTADRGLVMRAQSGDRGAFGVLVDKYRFRVLKLSLRHTRSRTDAEDAVQETFMKAYGALKDFRGEAAFYSWLYRIAINTAKTLSALRIRQSSVSLSDLDSERIDDASFSDVDTPEDLLSTEELYRAVNAAIERLPSEQRIALELHEFEECSYSQVATCMSCPVGTVRSRIFRARDAINGYLRTIFEDRLEYARASRIVPRNGGRESDQAPTIGAIAAPAQTSEMTPFG
jgi:RNA polymerase sigma-70 factor, ECF subfamily